MSTRTFNSSGLVLRQRVAKIATYIVLIFASLVFLAPMLVMLINSFKSDAEMYINPVGLPLNWTLVSYARLFGYEGQQLIRNYANSVVIAGISTILAVIFCAMAGFAFSKYRFRGDSVIFRPAAGHHDGTAGDHDARSLHHYGPLWLDQHIYKPRFSRPSRPSLGCSSSANIW